MKKTRHFFNLLEIALAIAVIAIGLSGVMSLYALGAKTHQAAMADNQVADIADYIFAYIKAQISNSNQIDGEKKIILDEKIVMQMKSSSDEDYPKYIAEILDRKKYFGTEDVLNLENLPSKWKKVSDSLYRLDTDNNLPNTQTKGMGVFLYIQKTDDNIDFSALIFVYEDFIDNLSLKYIGPEEQIKWKTYSGTQISKFAKSICIDICYPAEFPAERRNTVTFKTEIFNEKFELL